MTFHPPDRAGRAGFDAGHEYLLPLAPGLLRRKAVFDKTLALLMLPFLLPLGLLITCALLLTDGAPVFYGQWRVGRGGRRFRCWKFRSMVRDADAALDAALAADPGLRQQWELQRKLDIDPRIHPLGNLLRRTSLDELPQIWNVLIGDMSFVGPRPVVEEELVYYGPYLPDYLAVRPGLTGAWQVSGRSNTTYDERVALDVDYVRGMSIQRDIKIVLATVKVVLLQTGAR
ncbi:sugar transferase [Pseudooceanicola sp. LIPI14-2-Ac024]|uniref:sugar transferase n=1 Tax=Pseudooceanicola sp. LIPI14-2-Ac024 TaxID=3344875 RepID=UPI0035D095F7